jgi:hypothetical protein
MAKNAKASKKAKEELMAAKELKAAKARKKTKAVRQDYQLDVLSDVFGTRTKRETKTAVLDYVYQRVLAERIDNTSRAANTDPLQPLKAA